MSDSTNVKDTSGNLAEIENLSVSFMTDAGSIKAIDKVNFTIPRKTVVGVVGESGSGKSVTARSIIKLLPETATTSGAIYLSNRADSERLDVLSLSGEDLRRMRGSEAAMVFQEPNSVLNPVYTIGWQIEEGLRAHGMKDKKERRAKAIDILKKVGIPEAETRIDCDTLPIWFLIGIFQYFLIRCLWFCHSGLDILNGLPVILIPLFSFL